jgi:hypothetical protein
MIAQPSLFEERPAPTVGTLNAIVLKIMSDGRWRMPHEIRDIILRTHRVMIADATPRLRDLRKSKYGSHTVEKRIRAGSRAYEYRLVR